MALLTPAALALAALALPIILLYMLRLRRREVLVASTLLWQQVLQDREANTPWQKLRRNALLFLQLLILALLVLALARPFIIVPTVSRGQIELLLDASASMNAADLPNGQTRFSAAQQQALGIVATLGVDDRLTVIRVADQPDVLIASSQDPLALRAAILGAQPSHAAADWVSALTLAAADAVNSATFDLVIVSDGGLGAAAGLPGIPGNIRYLPIGAAGQNLAVSALATRALPGQAPELFAQITNYGDQPAETIFTLRVDGAIFTSQRYTVPAGAQLPLVAGSLPAGFQTVQATLTQPAESATPDYLALDNSAWALARTAAERRALLVAAAPNRFIEQALGSLPGLHYFKADARRSLPSTPYDFYIFDGWLPDVLPDGDLLIVNPPANSALFRLAGYSDQTGNLNLHSADPRLTYVDFRDVNVQRFQRLTGVDWADALVTVDGGALVLAGEVDGRQVALLPFDLHETDLPLRVAWPVLVANLLDWFAPPAIVTEAASLTVGGSLTLRPPLTADTLRFTLPDGTQRLLPIERAEVAFAETDQLGLYRVDVLQGADVLQSAQFPVNLFAPSESQLAPQSSLTLNQTTIAPAQAEASGQREVWPLAAALAVLVLLIEWYAYHRRNAPRTAFGWLRWRSQKAAPV